MEHPVRELRGLVLPFHGGDAVHELPHQPIHLRRQIPRIPARRQTARVQTEHRSSSADPRFSNKYFAKLTHAQWMHSTSSLPASTSRGSLTLAIGRELFYFVTSVVHARNENKSIGVASYGAVGHVPPLDFQLFNFSGHFRAAQTLTFDSVCIAYPVNITLLVSCPRTIPWRRH